MRESIDLDGQRFTKLAETINGAAFLRIDADILRP